MEKGHKLDFKRLAILTFFFFAINTGFAQKSVPKVGAYYFDGWSGTTFHITEDLKTNYPEREPKWGWVTSTPEFVDEQVKLAADAGLSFFSFCWYPAKDQQHQELKLNRALKYYKSSKNVKRLEYCLLIANHAGYEVGPKEWDDLKRFWITEFKHKQYLKIDGKPLLIFFEHSSLVKNFGTVATIKKAFEELRQSAVEQGLPGVSIAICEGSPEGATIASSCGADLITGYNYHSAGFEGSQQQAIPIEKMQLAEQKLWTRIGNATQLKYIPVSTIGWDPRPWSNDKNKYFEKPYYTGFSAGSVKHSVKGMLNWMKNSSSVLTKEKVALLYAWNENGEGAWLTPGKTGLNPLEGIRKELK